VHNNESGSKAGNGETAAVQVQRSVLDEGAHMRPDLWPNLGVININMDTCSWSALQPEGGKPFTYRVWGANCMLLNQLLKFHHPYPYPLLCHPLTPSCARIYQERVLSRSDVSMTSALNAGSRPTCCMEKALPPSGAPPRRSSLHQTLESTWGAWQRSAGIRGSAISTGQLTSIPWKRRPFQTCRHGQERRCRGSRTLMRRHA
jgi:hypothetical protein